MKRSIVCIAVTIFAVFTVPSGALAQDPQPYCSAGLFLLFPTGARNSAMAGTGVADDTDPINVAYNPANLALMRGAAVQGSYVKWPSDIRLYDVGLFAGTEYSGYQAYRSNIAASIRYSAITLDSQDESPVFLPEGTGREFSDDWYVPITFAAAMTRDQTYFAGGATVKIVEVGLEDEPIRFTTFDFGLAGGTSLFAREPFLFDVSGGVSWSNHGGTIDCGTSEADPPAEFRAGLGFRFELIDSEFSRKRSLITFGVNTDFLDSRQSSGYLAGAELGVVDTAFLRIGQRDDVFLNGGFSFGFGFQLKIKRFAIRADYAQTPGPFDQDVDIFGLLAGTAF